MALTRTNGQTVMDGTEQNLFGSQTILQHYATWIFFDALLAGDKIVVRVYVNDGQDVVERVYDKYTVPGPVDDPAIFNVFVPTDSYRVTCEQTDGTNRTISWQRLET